MSPALLIHQRLPDAKHGVEGATIIWPCRRQPKRRRFPIFILGLLPQRQSRVHAAEQIAHLGLELWMPGEPLGGRRIGVVEDFDQSHIGAPIVGICAGQDIVHELVDLE